MADNLKYIMQDADFGSLYRTAEGYKAVVLNAEDDEDGRYYQLEVLIRKDEDMGMWITKETWVNAYGQPYKGYDYTIIGPWEDGTN